MSTSAKKFLDYSSFFIAASFAFGADPSYACTFIDPTLEEMRLSISDGQILPANLIIFGQFTGQDDGSSYWLLDSNDASIRLSMEIQPSEGFTQLVPELPLAVDETYRLIFSASQNPPTEDSIERLSFSTSAPDESAPSSPIATHEINEIFPDPFGPCGPVNGETWVRFFVQPNEAEQIAIYRLLDGNGETKDINIAPFISRDDDGNIFLSETASAGQKALPTRLKHFRSVRSSPT